MTTDLTTRLANFGLAVLKEGRREGGSDVDGGTIQDLAELHGLLIRVAVTEPCGEHCWCVEYGEFPQSCLRYAEGVHP